LTLPNQGAPFGSVPFGGLSEFAGNNIDDWLLQLRDEIVARVLQLLNPGAAIQQFANDAGVPQLAELLRSAIEGLLVGSALDFLNQIIAAITGNNGTLQDLANWAQAIAGFPELVQTLIDSIYKAITGINSIDTLIADLITALQNIPFANILGILGPSNIGDALQEGFNYLVGGFVDVVEDIVNVGLSDVWNIANMIGSQSALGAFSWDILGIRNNASMWTGMLPTSDSTVPLTAISNGATAPTIAVTDSAALTGWKRIPEATSVGVARWYGYGVTGITDFRVIVSKLDSSNNSEVVYQSSNIVGDLDAGGSASVPPVQYHALTTPIAVEASDTIGVELVAIGGTHSVAGQSMWLPEDPHALPKRMASVRNASTPPPVNPLVLSDPFDTLDASGVKWNYGAGVSVQSGWLKLHSSDNPVASSVLVDTGASFPYELPYTIPELPFNFAEHPQVYVETQPVSGTSSTRFGVYDVADATDSIQIYHNNGNLYFAEYVNGVVDQTSVVFNASTHRWWRLRYAAGSIYWDTSTNGFSWTNRRSKTLGAIAITDMRVVFAVDGGAPVGDSLFDNLNLNPAANLATTTTVPFIELAIDAGLGADFHSPKLFQYVDDGSMPVPNWANHIQSIVLGAGAGGNNGGLFWGLYGKGGEAGRFNAVQWDRGVHFGDNTMLNYNIGGGGNPNGGSGGPTIMSIPGYSITGTGGPGDDVIGVIGQIYGRSPGNALYFGDMTVAGGVSAGVLGAPGNPYGGGGAGGNHFAGSGGPGAQGSAWARFMP